jgi:hypothetical protein
MVHRPRAGNDHDGDCDDGGRHHHAHVKIYVAVGWQIYHRIVVRGLCVDWSDGGGDCFD